MIKKIVKKPIQIVNKFLKKTNWYNLRSTEKMSKIFGLDRGQPIDRYYIEKFLLENKQLIKGVVLEIAENTYSKKYGNDVSKYEILHKTADNTKATIIGDLTKLETLPKSKIDCFICTQTFNFIYNFQDAIRGSYYLLKNNGVILATVAGISQISKYDMDRWGDYWRFTTLSIEKSFADVFGAENVNVDFYGNILTSIAFLEGLASDELTNDELNYKDENYQLILTIIATKKE